MFHRRTCRRAQGVSLTGVLVRKSKLGTAHMTAASRAWLCMLQSMLIGSERCCVGLKEWCSFTF